MIKRLNFFLFGIIVLAAVLRFWGLSSNPPSLTWDEVAWGYNAYTLGEDARDEFGKFLPAAYLESFGDFKPPLYAYLSIIPVKIFGMTEFGTRFISAFLGTLTVLLTYFLTRRLIGDSLSFSMKSVRLTPSLLAAFILAISPWHILLSRAAFEANVASFFIVLGVLLFLKTKDSMWYLTAAAVSFVLAMYTFNTARIVVPPLVLILAFSFRKDLISSWKKTLIAGFVGLLLFFPLLQFLMTPQAQLRFQEVNIFSDIAIIERTNQLMENNENAWWSKIIHNRRLAYSVEYLKHYFDNLSPSFLFIEGDGNPKFSIQDVGQMYIWEIPFVILGALFLFKKREKNWWIIPLWILIGIAPAATARETPHALRIESVIPMFQIISAYGILAFMNMIPTNVHRISLRVLLLFLVVIFVVTNFIYFAHNYFVHYPREFSGEWQYGYKEAIQYTEEVKDEYETIYFTTELGRPYAYVLFYGDYTPDFFRNTADVEREVLGFVNVEGFGKYRFERELTNRDEKALYVNVPKNVPEGAEILKEFYLLNGQTALVAYTL